MFERPEDKEAKSLRPRIMKSEDVKTAQKVCKEKVSKEDLRISPLDKDILLFVGAWLLLFWFGFGIGFLVGRI